MNEFGVLEVITEDLECAETLNTSSESETNNMNLKGGSKPKVSSDNSMDVDTKDDG